MDFVSPLYKTLQAQATLDQTQATTQDTKALAQMRMLGVVAQQQQIERENQMRDALQKQFSNPTSPAAGAPPQQAQQQQRDQEYPGEIFESLSQAREGVLRANNMVRLTGAYGDVKGNQKANENLDNQQKELRLALNDALKEKLRRNDEAAQIFGSVENSDQLVSALTYAANNLPKAQVARLAQQVYANLPDPATATPEQIKATLDPVRNQFIKGGDVLRAQTSATAAKIAQGNLEQRQIENVRRNTEAAMKQAGAADAASIDPETVDYYAEQSLKGDNSWQVGLARGKVGQALISAVKDRIPQMAKEREITPTEAIANKASVIADTAALRDRTKFVAASNQFVRNMDKQIDLVDRLIDGGTIDGVPAISRWIQSGRKQIAGDPDVTKLDVAIRGLAREHQRIVTGVTSNAQLHVSAQQTADELLNIAQTPDQIRGAISVMREEAENARQAGMEEIGEARKRLSAPLSGGAKVADKKTGEASDAAMNATVKGAATVGEVRAGRGGKQYKFKGGDPTDAKNWESVGG